MNLRKQVEPLFVSRARGFLGSEACTTRDLAARLGLALAQTSLRKPSRAKQELLRILAWGQRRVKVPQLLANEGVVLTRHLRAVRDGRHDR